MKVIGFDLASVLVWKNSFKLSDIQDKTERLFRKNRSDYEYKKLVEEKIYNKILNI